MTTADVVRWGILGTGNIAKQFARGLAATPDAMLAAVGSRTTESAEAFAREFNVPRPYASYEELANDPDVDAIYIGTPHPYHFDNAMLCLNAGKAVLCEKPFTINAGETAKLIETARAKNVFLMEAMWTRFLPIIVRVRELLTQGAIGEPRMLLADFGFRTQFNAEARLFNPELGGGALLDVGIYPISLASMIFGKPEQITSMANLGATGVDEEFMALFGYGGARMASLTAATRTNTPQAAHILGSNGSIVIHTPWFNATTITVKRNDQDDETIELPREGNGYNYEAAEVGRCLRAGKLESDVMPLDETLELMQTLDAIRAQWGLRYPSEA